MEGGSLTMSKKEHSLLVVVSRVKEKQMTINRLSKKSGGEVDVDKVDGVKCA